MNRFEMFNAMVNGKAVVLISNGVSHKGVIMGIQLEDGSGHNFIVLLRDVMGVNRNIFVRSPK